MILFISNFNDLVEMSSDSYITSFRQELKVVAVVVVFLFLLEFLARVIAPHLDYDRMHISKFGEIVADMPAEDRRESGHLCVLGNSLLMHGFDEELFGERLPSVAVTKLTPVGTAVHDWEMLFRRYLEGEGSLPKHLVIGFVAHHINDSEPVKLRRMARHFADVGDLPYLWDHEAFDFHLKTQSVLSHYSALIGDQPEHRLRSLECLIPDYRRGLNRNKDFTSRVVVEESGGARVEPGFRRMSRFLARCEGHGIEVYLVPMPQPEVWDMRPEVGLAAAEYGAVVLDARRIEGMGASDFSDGYHLGETGVVKFTNWLADEFKRLGVYGDE